HKIPHLLFGEMERVCVLRVSLIYCRMMTPLKVILGFCFMMCIATGHAQKISTLDIVSIKQQYEKEALFFYEQNWKVFREEALNRKYISGYQLLRKPPDSIGHFH